MVRTIWLEDLKNDYTWSKHEFKFTNKEDLKSFFKSKYKQVGIDKNFNVPIYISFIDLDCIIIYKDGRKEIARFDQNSKGFIFLTNEGRKTFGQLKKVDKIIFLDDFRYHESLRYYWTDRGVKGDIYNHKESFLNDLLKEF